MTETSPEKTKAYIDWLEETRKQTAIEKTRNNALANGQVIDYETNKKTSQKILAEFWAELQKFPDVAPDCEHKTADEIEHILKEKISVAAKILTTRLLELNDELLE